MKYEVRKSSGVFTLHQSNAEIGEININPLGHDISGHINGYGTFSFVPKGFLFWHRWEYTERESLKYILKTNNWRTLSLKDKQSDVDLDGTNITVNGEVVSSIVCHVNDIYLDNKFVKNLLRRPKTIYDKLNDKPMYTFELHKKEYLAFVFASCVQEWVRTNL